MLGSIMMKFKHSFIATNLLLSTISIVAPLANANDNSGIFVGARIGLFEGYEKSAVINNNNSALEGTFKANGVGLQIGYNAGDWRALAEYNPKTDAEVANEVAPVSSFLVGADYNIWHADKQSIGFGAFIADTEFELEVGPAGPGKPFKTNPTAEGITFGLMTNYHYSISPNWGIGADFRYALESFDGSGENLANEPIDIEIKNYRQLNFTAAYHF